MSLIYNPYKKWTTTPGDCCHPDFFTKGARGATYGPERWWRGYSRFSPGTPGRVCPGYVGFRFTSSSSATITNLTLSGTGGWSEFVASLSFGVGFPATLPALLRQARFPGSVSYEFTTTYTSRITLEFGDANGSGMDPSDSEGPVLTIRTNLLGVGTWFLSGTFAIAADGLITHTGVPDRGRVFSTISSRP